MKKIFTLFAATLLTAAVFAADHKPSVTLKSSKNYEVVIDGRSLFSSTGIMDISSLRGGTHTIKVFETKKGIMFRKSRKMVSSSTFQLGRNDVAINIDFRGQISITEKKSGWDSPKGNDHDNRKNTPNRRF